LNAQEDGLGTKCVMLAILPEDSWVPISVVGQLWGTNDMDTKEAVMGLESWHLIDVNWEAYSLFIIDLHLDYFRATAKDDLGLWHTTLLQQSSQRVIGVFCVPDDEKLLSPGTDIGLAIFWTILLMLSLRALDLVTSGPSHASLSTITFVRHHRRCCRRK
jgi:hypothetical protein